MTALTTHDYELLQQHLGTELSAEDVRARLAAHPDEVLAPPDEVFEKLDVLDDLDATRPTFHIAVRLWSVWGGQSRVVAKFRVRQSDVHPLAMESVLVGLDLED